MAEARLGSVPIKGFPFWAGRDSRFSKENLDGSL
jgi:hypothetical protein